MITQMKKEMSLEERTETILEKYSWKALIKVHNLYLEKRCCDKLYDAMLDSLSKNKILSKEPLNNYGIFTIIESIMNPRNSQGTLFYFTSKNNAEIYPKGYISI